MSAEPLPPRKRTSPLAAILLAGLLLIAGAVAVWSVFGGDPDVHASPSPNEEQPEDPDGEARKTSSQQPAAVEAGARQPIRKPDDASAGSTSGNKNRIKITCLLKGTNQPAAHAKVLYEDPAFDYKKMSPEQQAESGRLSRDRESWMERFGRHEMSDANGVAYLTLPKSGYWSTVCARLGDQFGITWITMEREPPEGGHRILLEKDLGFHVKTVDARRQPVADVPLVVLYTRYDKDFDQIYESAHPVGATDSGGRFHIRHMQNKLAIARKQGSSTPFRVCLHIPGHHREGIDLTLERLPTEPVLLTVPPTGQVEVRLVDRLGHAMPAKQYIELFVDGETRSSVTKDNVRRSASQWRAQTTGKKPAVFKLVGLGQKLVARLMGGGGNPSGSNHVFAGPTRAGETVRVKLTLGDGAPVIVGRALDDGGKPIGKKPLKLYVYHGEHPIRQNVTTDEEGNFRAQLPRATRPALVTKVRFDLLDKDQHPVGIGAVRPVTNGSGDNGKIDLGDVVLTESPLLLAGRLIGKGDLSEKTVRLVVQRRDAAASGRPVFESGVTILRQDENRFEVRGYPATNNLQIQGYSKKHLPTEPLPFAPGDKDVVIRMWQGGSLKAKVRWGKPWGHWGLTMQMVPTDPRTHSIAEKHHFRTRGNLRFLEHSDDDSLLLYTWASLWPGRYRLEVKVFGSKKPMQVVEGILIEEGKETRDVRLQNFDLRATVLRVTLRCQDAGGKPIQRHPGKAMVLLLENGKPTGDAIAMYEGLAFLVGARSSFDVKVLVPGYKPKTVVGITKNTDVRLESGPRLRFRIKPAPPRLASKNVLAVSLERDLGEFLGSKRGRMLDPAAGGPILVPKLRYSAFSNNRELPLAVPGPGSYSVILHVRREPRNPWDEYVIGTRISGVRPAEIVVKDTPTEQLFELQVPEASWKKAGVGR